MRRALAPLLVLPLLVPLAGDDCGRLRRELVAAKARTAAEGARLRAAEARAREAQQQVTELEAVRTAAARARAAADALRDDPRAAAEQRACESRISGGAADDAAGDVRVPPLTLRFAATFALRPRSRYDPVGGEKAIAVVDPGGEATIVVAEEARDDVALTYSARPAPAVRFHACPDGQTAFNGGFAVAGARCVPLDVHPGGSARPVRVVVSFAAGRCPSG